MSTGGLKSYVVIYRTDKGVTVKSELLTREQAVKRVKDHEGAWYENLNARKPKWI